MNQTASRPFANFIELLSSMRFAISLLVFICLASIIGTVIPQGRSANAYIDMFGPFWFDIFNRFSIWHIYNNWWFLVTMAFLVTSTSLCLIRNAPKMLKEARSFREHIRTSSLQSFQHVVFPRLRLLYRPGSSARVMPYVSVTRAIQFCSLPSAEAAIVWAISLPMLRS